MPVALSSSWSCASAEPIANSAAGAAASLFLEVAADNAAARALYAEEGFCRVGQRRRYYPGGGDALVLRRMIDPPIIDPAEVTIS